MLLKLWERLRGYNKWTEAQAVIKSSQVQQVVVGHTRDTNQPVYAWQGDEEVAWTSEDGVEHSELFEVDEGSPLFKMYDGNPLTIRYDPQNPDHFYVRDQLRHQVNRGAKIALALLIVVAVILVIALN